MARSSHYWSEQIYSLKFFIMKRISGTFIAIIVAALTLTACKKDQPEGGTFKVRMTDAPADYEALNMTLLSVEAYHKDNGWITLEGDAQQVNVLSLTNGKETTIAFNSEAEAGLYTKLRLRFGSESSLEYQQETTLGGVATTSTSLTWTGTREVIIPINVQVSGSTGVDILLDFDAAASVIEASSAFIIAPVINVMTNETTGIKGKVTGSSNALVKASNTSGEVSTYIDVSGDFMIRGLADGTYTVTVISSAEDRENGAPEQIVFSGIVVSKGEFTSMGTINLQ